MLWLQIDARRELRYVCSGHSLTQVMALFYTGFGDWKMNTLTAERDHQQGVFEQLLREPRRKRSRRTT